MPSPAESPTAPPEPPVRPREGAARRAAFSAWAILLVSAFLGAAAPVRAADSLSVHWEAGTAAEVSNEQFYESAIDDTTFLGRKLYSDPETRLAVVALAEVFRSWQDGRWLARFTPSASVGEKATRLGAIASIGGRPSEIYRFVLEPRFEYQRDASFGLEHSDWRASLVGRVRRLSLDELGVLRFNAGAEVVRVIEASDPFVLSGTSGRAALGYTRSPLFGPDWDAEYGAIVRTFRDSTSRDHVEQRLAVSLREDDAWGNSLGFAVDAVRRDAVREVASTRDRFSQVHALADGSFGPGNGWSLRPELRAEITRYDDPDSLVDFDYELYGAGLPLRSEMGPEWRVSTGPRFELLSAPACPWEECREFAWTFELEKLTGGSWWSLAPVLGRRNCKTFAASEPLGNPLTASLHSSFDFVEVSAFLDQPLPGALRTRAMGTLRAERHDDRDHDALSLYFSLDVRRLF